MNTSGNNEMTKEEVIQAIYCEWARQFGGLSEVEEEQKDKFYFMLGFVSAAIDNMEQPEREKTSQYNHSYIWYFSKIEVPDIGDYVWVCNARDKKSKLINWGAGDEAFFSYWMPADIPEPPKTEPESKQ